MCQQNHRVTTKRRDTGIETVYLTHAGMFLFCSQSFRTTRIKTGAERRRKNNCIQNTYVGVSGCIERNPIKKVTSMTP